jgi:hypothetical protein
MIADSYLLLHGINVIVWLASANLIWDVPFYIQIKAHSFDVLRYTNSRVELTLDGVVAIYEGVAREFVKSAGFRAYGVLPEVAYVIGRNVRFVGWLLVCCGVEEAAVECDTIVFCRVWRWASGVPCAIVL